MLALNNIKNVHLELSSNCNASCPLCQRNFFGYKINNGYEVTELRLDDIKKIFHTKFIFQLDSIDFNGNFGDFMLAQDALEILGYLRTYNKRLQLKIHTNGSARPSEFWRELATYDTKVFFDLDGLEDTHSRYRIGTDFNRIIANAQTYIDAGGHAIWKMIPFEHNAHQIEECQQLSQQMGFKEFVLFDQGRNAGPVYDRKGQYLYNLEKNIKWKFDSVFDHMKFNATHVSRKITAPLPVSCKAIEKTSIYIAANGEVYPCCFLGHSPRTYKGGIQGIDQIKKLLEDNGIQNNAKDRSLEECVNWFDLIEDTWSKSSFADGNMLICSKSCGKCN